MPRMGRGILEGSNAMHIAKFLPLIVVRVTLVVNVTITRR
jgi:hypothetical protein